MSRTKRIGTFYYVGIILFIISSVCAGQDCILGSEVISLTDWSRTIRNPLTADREKYPANQTCAWNIKLPEETTVKVDIVKIDLEYYDGDKNKCLYDYIEVNSSSETWRACRKNQNISWTSDTNEVNISFHSDGSLQNEGFVLNYIGVCGKHFSLTDKAIHLNIPRVRNKQHHIRCNWTVDVQGYNGPGFTFTWKGHVGVSNDSSWKVSTDGLSYKDLAFGNDSYVVKISNATDLMTIIYEGLSLDTDTDVEQDNLITALEIDLAGPHCVEDVFTYANIDIIFPGTRPGLTASVPCPGDVMGMITRQCAYITSGKAMWKRPDLLKCVNQIILDVDKKVSQLTEHLVIDKDTIIGEMTRLYNATSVDNLELFPGDMVMSTKIVGKIPALIQNTSHGSVESFANVAQSYADAVGSIINPDKLYIWKNIQFDFVEQNMANILTSVEDLSENIAKKHFHEERTRKSVHWIPKRDLHVRTKYIEFSISSTDRTSLNDGNLEIYHEYNTSSITLPSSVLQLAKDNINKQSIQVYNGRFTSISSILLMAKTEETKYESSYNTTNQSDPDVTVVNSDIVSSKILNVPESRFSTLDKPVTLVFTLQNFTLSFYLRQKCVFMNMSAKSPLYRWSDVGCQIDDKRSNFTHTVCTCSHLTNFAVLMDIYDVTKLEDIINYRILSYISYIGGGLSIVCCVIAVIVYEYFRLRKERVRIHEQLAVSIIIVQILFLVGIDRTENKYVCMSIAIALHYFLLSMFCWMLVEGFHLYVMLVKVFKTRTNFKKYLIIGWGVPLVVVSVSTGVFHDQYGNDHVCWLSHVLLLAAFVPAVAFVVFVNTVILLMVLRITLRSMVTSPKYNTEEQSVIRSGLKAAAILLPLLGITWTFGFLTINNKETIIFTYLFTFFNSLQGVFFFFFHCLQSVDVQNAYNRHSYRKSMQSFTYSTSKNATARKNSYGSSNDSKSSSRTHLTDVSNADNRESRHVDTDDRLHRNPDLFREMWLKDNVSRSLFRSQSDGIPHWKQNNGHLLFRRSMSSIDSLAGHNAYDINTSESRTESTTLPTRHMYIPRVNSLRINNMHTKQPNAYNHPCQYNQSDDTYPGYLATRNSLHTNNQSNDRLYLADKEHVNQTEDDEVFIPTVSQRSDNTSTNLAFVLDNEQQSTDSVFLRELKTKANSLRKT